MTKALRQQVLEKWAKVKQTIAQNNSGPLVSKKKVRMKLCRVRELVSEFFDNIRNHVNLNGRFKEEIFAKSFKLIQDFITREVEEFEGELRCKYCGYELEND